MRFTCDACVRKVCVCVLDVSSVYLKKMRAFVFVFVFVLFCIFISPINSQLFCMIRFILGLICRWSFYFLEASLSSLD